MMNENRVGAPVDCLKKGELRGADGDSQPGDLPAASHLQSVDGDVRERRCAQALITPAAVSYTHLRAHETVLESRMPSSA